MLLLKWHLEAVQMTVVAYKSLQTPKWNFDINYLIIKSPNYSPWVTRGPQDQFIWRHLICLTKLDTTSVLWFASVTFLDNFLVNKYAGSLCCVWVLHATSPWPMHNAKLRRFLFPRPSILASM